jgi:hypothetical protein
LTTINSDIVAFNQSRKAILESLESNYTKLIEQARWVHWAWDRVTKDSRWDTKDRLQGTDSDIYGLLGRLETYSHRVVLDKTFTTFVHAPDHVAAYDDRAGHFELAVDLGT